MADVAINTGMDFNADAQQAQKSVVYISPTVGYVFGVTSNGDFNYWKTSDAAATWGSPVAINTGAVSTFCCWHDEWTTGVTTDTIIHMWYLDAAGGAGSSTLLHRTLDVSSDTLGTERTVVGSLTVTAGGAPATRSLSGIQTLGGNLLVAWRDGTATERGLSRSIDAGVNWTARADIFAADDDHAVLIPGNVSGGDNQDCWAIYNDKSVTDLILREYDDSGNSFNDTNIDTDFTTSVNALNIGVSHRQSDDHAIVAMWSEADSATADLRVYDIASNASITAKTNVLTNIEEAVECPVFINQQNDDIYVLYLSGGTFGVDSDAHYQKSTDDGGTWGGETSLNANSIDDLRSVWIGNGVGDNGGLMMGTWFNDDLDDFFTNAADNAVSIAAAAVGGSLVIPRQALPMAILGR